MKEKILQLRSEGKSYGEIAKILGCSKSTAIYNCDETQREKANERTRKKRSKHAFCSKIERFKYRILSEKSRTFQRREKSYVIPRKEYNFNLEDVLNKIGENPICYLSGKKLDISDSKSYHFDHIIPATRGGSNTLDNLGVLSASVNKMKHDLTPDELINLCKEILIHNGYEIRKIN